METAEMSFRQLVHKTADGLTSENVKMIRYLCKDAIPHGMELPTALSFFEYFESKGWINPSDMTFLAEVLYRINRHDLLKRLPGVKNRKDYEENFLLGEVTQNFTPFRIACFQLIDELTSSDFSMMRNFCRDKLSSRNYQKSTDIITLLVCLEEEDLISDGDLEFILCSLRHLDNQIPYQLFDRLSKGDFSITLPKRHQSFGGVPSSSSPYGIGKAASLPQFSHQNLYMPHFSNDGRAGNFLEQSQSISQYPSVNPGMMNYGSGPFSHPNYQRGKPNHNVSPLYGDNSRTFSEVDLTTKHRNNVSTHLSIPVAESELTQHPQHDAAQAPCSTDDTSLKLTFVSCTQNLSQVATSNSQTSVQNGNRQVPSALSDRFSRISVMPASASDVPYTDGDLTNAQPSNDFLDEDSSFPSNSHGTQVTRRNLGDYAMYSPPTELEKTVVPEQLESYDMDTNPVGICLIINNYTFEGSANEEEAKRRLMMNSTDYQVPNIGLRNRVGSQYDASKVAKVFRNFGFEVKCYQDLDSRAMANLILQYSKMNHSNYSCFVTVMMSHGLEGVIYGTDGMPLPVSLIKKEFRPEACPTLLDKPKIFFLQACQGDRSMEGHSPPVADLETDSANPTPTPSEADFLLCYSTVPGYTSYRSRSYGSLFINCVIANLEKYHSTEDLLSIMIKVNNEMASKPVKQMSMPIATLRKKVYFKKVDAADTDELTYCET